MASMITETSADPGCPDTASSSALLFLPVFAARITALAGDGLGDGVMKRPKRDRTPDYLPTRKGRLLSYVAPAVTPDPDASAEAKLALPPKRGLPHYAGCPAPDYLRVFAVFVPDHVVERG